MGVYIKGMEMPKSCNKCNFCRDWGLCIVSEKWTPKEGNAPDCPLIPVPEHGRLIDADALLMRINHEVMEAYMDGACYGVHPSQEYLYLLGEIIDDAQTIIQAEGCE